MGRGQSGSVFVFDEPTIGLHPLDVLVLLRVFDSLVASGATVVVIEHDLDVIANADYLIDMGPGGGMAGGRIVCEGTPETVRACPDSVTGRYLVGKALDIRDSSTPCCRCIAGTFRHLASIRQARRGCACTPPRCHTTR